MENGRQSRHIVAVLEDTPSRVAAMRRALSADSHLTFQVFERAPDFAAWIAVHTEVVALISLDYHLGPRAAGTGLDAARALAASRPFAPVILHSSDSTGARGQEEVLGDAGWVTARFPFGESDWLRAVRMLLGTDE